MQAKVACGDRMSGAGGDDERENPSRSEAAEYVHDMAGQLAALAERFGLTSAAEALKRAQTAIERDY